MEVVLAAAILGIISMTVYQFTTVTVNMTGISARESEESQACAGFRRLLETQLSSLPLHQSGSLIGMVIDRKGSGRRDALQLVCPAGNALLTPDAKGLYEITLTLRELPRGSGHYSLGMERTPWEDDDLDDDDEDNKASSTKATNIKVKQALPSDWVTLLDGVKGLEFAYFDARLNGWVDKWTDTTTMPSLVRVRLTMGENHPSYEIVERVPGGASDAHGLPNFDANAVPDTVGNPPGRVQKPSANGGQANDD